MIRQTVPMLALASIASPAFAAEVQIASSGPVVEMSVTESVAADPDIATISAGVTTQAATAVEAMQQNATQMTRVIARIEALGIARDDIQTAGINLNPVYDYNRADGRPEFRGYQVSNRVSVKLRDIERTGRVLDALVSAGASDLGGIEWGIDNPKPAQEQARNAAFASARERAMNYARMAGYADIRLLEVSEAVSSAMPMPIVLTAMREAAAPASTPVRPGQVQASVTVTVKYEMTR